MIDSRIFRIVEGSCPGSLHFFDFELN
jgi:hypothetical protein